MWRIKQFLKKAWFPILIVLLAVSARLIPGPRAIDDAYITFRYAQNILDGNGFVYNPGERVLGTTTPLYTLLMVLSGWLAGGSGAPFPWLSLVINAAADALTCLLLLRLGRHLRAKETVATPVAGACAALAWAVAPFSVTFAIGGLETSLYVFLLTATVTAYVEKRSTATALCAVLALLTRPDALILVGPLLLDRFWQAFRHQDRIKPLEAIVFLLPAVGWLVFSSLYFGSPIPHSVTAKTAAYHLSAEEGLIRLLQHYATLFHQDDYLGSVGIGVGLVLFVSLYIAGIVFAWKNTPRLRAWLVYPALYLAVYAVANPLIFRWYLTPPLPALFLLVFFAAEHLLKELFKVKEQPENRDTGRSTFFRTRVLVPIILALPLLSLVNAWTLHPDHGPNRPAPEMAYIKLELIYQQVAEWLAPQLQPGEVLAAGDVGVLGYYTRARILDTVGLNSRQSVKYYPLPDEAYVINYAISSDLIIDEQPDWLVTLEVYGRNTLLKDDRFLEQYELVMTIPTDMYGSQGMLIFQKLNY
ncbi:MAG: hypothetical protein LLG42_16010 [Chloroflexi bacterium]|nr:hypothetical protein [Chloroflexota bacterium]